MKWVALTILAAGCTTSADEPGPRTCEVPQLIPAGTVCSNLTPEGVSFVADPVAGQTRTGLETIDLAAGGTMDLAFELPDGEPFAWPYRVDVSAAIEIEDQRESGLTLRALSANPDAVGELFVYEADSDRLFDFDLVALSPVRSVALVGAHEASDVGTEQVLLAGATDVGIALYSTTFYTRLIDTSMQVTAAGSERIAWDIVRFDDPTATTHSVSVTAGTLPTTQLTIDTVPAVETVAPLQRTVEDTQGAVKNQRVTVCFGAFAGTRQVIGSTDWSFEQDGVPTAAGGPVRNCLETTFDTVGDHTVKATAGGRSATFTFYVDTDLRG